MINLFKQIAEEKNLEEALETVELLDEMLEHYNEVASDLKRGIMLLAIHEKAVEETILSWGVDSSESMMELKEFTMSAIEITKGLTEEIESLMEYKELLENLFDAMGFEVVGLEDEQ